MRVLRTAVTAVLIISAALAAPTVPASAADLPTGTSPGLRLPSVPYPPSGGPGAAGSDYYLGTAGDPSVPDAAQIRRLSDNSVVRVIPSANITFDGSAYLVRSPSTSDTRVTVRDVESDAVLWEFDPPQGERVVNASASRMVTCADPCIDLHVHRPDGTNVTRALARVSSFMGATGDLLVLRADDDLYTMNLATGESVALPTTPGETIGTVVFQTDRVYWTSYAGADDWLHWSAYDGSAPGVVQIPDALSERGWVAVGDSLAARLWDFDTKEGSLVPFDPSTGQIGTPLATHLPDAYPTQAGPTQALVVSTDSPTGTLLLADSTTRPARRVGVLTGMPRNTATWVMSGDRVVADFGQWNSPVGPTFTTSTDGSSPWSDRTTPDSPALTGGLIGVAGDVVVTRMPGWNTYRVTWPGGERTITGGLDPTVGHGGQALVRNVAGSLVVEDARTGTRLPVGSDAGVVVTGSTVWEGPSGGRIVQKDLRTGAQLRTLAVDPSCTSVLDILGRWAFLWCGPQTEVVVTDLQGILADQHLPYPDVMGNGFVGFQEIGEDASGARYMVLRVRDLAPGGGERLYGPLSLGGQGIPKAAADEAGGQRLGYLDDGEQLHVVDLPWLTQPPTALHDAGAPEVTSLTTSPRVTSVAVVTASWSARDTTDAPGERPAGTDSYDVRYHQGPVGGPYGSWQQPSSLQATRATTASLTPAPGSDTCFSVRARDARGNTSEWSAPVCSVIDGHAPALTSFTGGPRVTTSTVLGFSWAYTDPQEGPGLPGSGVACYDARVQYATKLGGAYGAWYARPDWQGLTTRSVTVLGKKGEDYCVQVRARDKAGRLSAWSASRCSSPDGVAPTITSASAGSLLRTTAATTKVTFSYRATDNLGVTSYDVGFQYAPPGKLMGGWQYPATWQRTASTQQSVSVPPGGQVCYAVRARDAIGNLTPWTTPRCAMVPFDDRAMGVTGSASRITSSLAVNGTITRLNAKGAVAYRAGMAGEEVHLTVLKGPAQGTIEVRANNHVFGRYSLAAPTWRRQTLVLSGILFTDATVRVITTTSAPARIDAITSRRY
ncbi:hypothetical protein [Terrabacter sp. BE26]|uniref:hypothetical protein n=1 Tax=Terrabacter sp. BE26 TaxID=2898152 RepID=UPI0035BE6E56